jgi:hypothetical protein
MDYWLSITNRKVGTQLVAALAFPLDLQIARGNLRRQSVHWFIFPKVAIQALTLCCAARQRQEQQDTHYRILQPFTGPL